MAQVKNNLITKLKKIYSEQGLDVGEDFELKASQLSKSRLAIEISLAQAGI